MPKIVLANGEFGTAGYEFDPVVLDLNLETFLWRLLLLTALAYFVWNDNISINIGYFSIQKTEMSQQFVPQKTDVFGLLDYHAARNNGLLLDNAPINNITFAIDPSFSKRNSIAPDTVNQRMQHCLDFVKRFSPVAIAEMRRFGVPASILLAQALLASDAGADPRAVVTNNFFLRSCNSGSCNSDHLEELDFSADALQLDVYPNLWGSFRDQSQFFKREAPYSSLIKYRKKDLKSWAQALDAGAYSGDRLYGRKLLALIHNLELQRFDGR